MCLRQHRADRRAHRRVLFAWRVPHPQQALWLEGALRCTGARCAARLSKASTATSSPLPAAQVVLDVGGSRPSRSAGSSWPHYTAGAPRAAPIAALAADLETRPVLLT
jgi:hypothetical protein